MTEDLPPASSEPATRPVSSEPAGSASARQQPVGTRPRKTTAGRVWIAVAAAVILLILLIIFIAENSASVKISFLGASGKISLALALLIAAVVGALITLLVGTARIVQLRREVRRRARQQRA